MLIRESGFNYISVEYSSFPIFCLKIQKLDISNLGRQNRCRRPNVQDHINSISKPFKSFTLLICWYMAIANLTLLNLIYLVLRSVGDFQFSHSNHFPGLAKCPNIDHRSTEPNISIRYFSLRTNAACQIVDVYDADEGFS